MATPKIQFEVFFIVGIFSLTSCNRGGCDTSQIDFAKLSRLKLSVYTSGPVGGLVLPNPIEATGNAAATATSSDTLSELDAHGLPNLLSPSRLENTFLKIRIKDIGDDLATLAKPGTNGFVFPLTDAHYSETMAYHSVESMIQYVKALGFSLDGSRPLYVMVRAEDPSNPNAVNAVYDHHVLNPSSPRTMRLFGKGQFAPGMDRDMYWHEIGHYVNESIRPKMDFAGDNSAVFTEGAALHECLADYLEESVSGVPHIGSWLARNFDGIQPGQPLRSAVDSDADRMTYDQVALNDGKGGNPERYYVAEWCTRVLWSIRTALVQADAEKGGVLSDRLIFGALSLSKQDTSLREFRNSLVEADKRLYCGENGDAIRAAFDERGYPDKFANLPTPMEMAETVEKRSDGTVGFALQLRNPTNVTARNVRVVLEDIEGRLYPTTYMQGYGDMPAGATLKIGGGSALGSNYEVSGELDQNAKKGDRIKYRLRLKLENGPETIRESEVVL